MRRHSLRQPVTARGGLATSCFRLFAIFSAPARGRRPVSALRGARVARGSVGALNYALTGGAVSALVLDSTGYPGELVQQVPHLEAPVLILHGLRDNPADGGSALTDPKMARSFEAALRNAGKTVEAKFYPAGTHNGIFASRAQRTDELQRIGASLRRTFSN